MHLKHNSIEFKNEIENKGIEYLIHFTPTLNLYSILEHSNIMSRAKLESLDIDLFDTLEYIQFTDDIRYDDKQYINLSLSVPNTYLLSKFKKKTLEDMTIKWCILKIDPKHIYDQETLFSVTNAASNTAKRHYKITGDLDKFKMLFSDVINITTYNGTRNIKRDNIKKKYPTDIQAEVLVKDIIPVDSIISVCFEKNNDLAEAKAAMNSFNTDNFIVDPSIFLPNRNK
jgi:hypothetical protein